MLQSKIRSKLQQIRNNHIQIVHRCVSSTILKKKENFSYFAKLSPAQSNFKSVGWAELALIPIFTHPPTPRESTEKVISIWVLVKLQR